MLVHTIHLVSHCGVILDMFDKICQKCLCGIGGRRNKLKAME